MKKPLHLLVDGADAVGKTTVINLLSRKLDLPIIKMPNMQEYIEKGTPEEFSKLFNETIVQFAEYSFIMDRGFTSSIVYSKVFDRDINLNYIENISTKLDPMIIILTRYEQESYGFNAVRIYKPLQEDPTFDNNKLEVVHREFIDLAEQRGFIMINTFNRTPQSICNEILNIIKK